MELGLKGKVAVITGGSKGIGYATAKEFLKEGASVAICARNQKEIEEAAETLGKFGPVYAETVDVSKGDEIYGFAQHVFEHFGRLDVWVNNVGTTGYKKADEYDEEEINLMVDTCFKSVVYGCQAAFRYMKNTGGAIVNVSSLAARCSSAGRSTLYGPLKSAINNLTNTFAGEYCANHIRVCCIMPGFTATPLAKAAISEEELQKNAMGTLLRRMAEPEEIAKPIVFLASDAASYMTATTIEVSGGRSMTLNPSFAYERLKEDAE
ncbi:SDR family NAD(P)-dependent oxidoreductase [Oribacterium sp. oral taxon 108]|uniref:SDR family NAD(P)-dependent oxidoreductase n=1 Tax=Oribacterium sp. oral taxon 108 TaxID=712414 RepID=UPI00020DD563|nr:SDR family oxidoreductase [Oribacterium sp. oral taxon 108]EGL37297.1 oxidoreductase, short chain dehydrogenase/reductase family protein [Oribacterium sp. oral taxon 108 str. F0425]